MTEKLLIIDDEDVFREDFARLLRRKGYDCRTACNGERGLAVLLEFNPDIVLCDIVMPDRDGIAVLDEIMRRNPQTSVMMITAHGSLDTAVAALRKGASDYVIKPLVIEDVLQKIKRISDYNHLDREVKFLRRAVQKTDEQPLIGDSEPMKAVRDLIEKVSQTRSTVLLQSQSGTGKEIVARAIASLGDPPDAPFVAINCAGISEQLLESELFGHVRGSFTGAIADREGFFELTGEGTAFLDEISEMPTTLQAKLLRVLEEREFVRVGDTKTIPLKSRIIVSTNRDLRALVEAGEFREDLFFRVAVFKISIPTLKERRSDIPMLTEHFISVFNKEMKRKCLGANTEVMRILMSYDWPGNVRELRNVIEHAMILATRDYITPAEIPVDILHGYQVRQESDSLRSATKAYEREHIRRVLLASGGNKEETARRLEINPATLYRKMAELQLGSSGE